MVKSECCGRKLCPKHNTQAYLQNRIKRLLLKSLQYFQSTRSMPWEYYLGADFNTVVTRLHEQMAEWNSRHEGKSRTMLAQNMVIDHIRPKQIFLRESKASRDQLCNHYTNLQPMLPEDNAYKGHYWSTADEQHWTKNIILQPDNVSLYYPKGLLAPSLM